MSRAHRLIELLQELRARRRPVTAQALAAALGVSPRTLYRDVAALRAQGARIEGEAGLGYVLRPGFLLPPLMFTPEELEAILLGAAWVAQREDLAMEAPARAALAKIAAVLPGEQAEGLEVAGLLPGPPREAPPLAVDARALRAALRRERKLRLAYVDGAAAASERVVWPIAIGVYQDAQLLAAWCELRGDYRHFRLDRIRRAEVLEARMPRRRAVLYQEWRARERACLPEALHERA
jgi:predicted DNA-binding transcriptional regulator YafY